MQRISLVHLAILAALSQAVGAPPPAAAQGVLDANCTGTSPGYYNGLEGSGRIAESFTVQRTGNLVFRPIEHRLCAISQGDSETIREPRRHSP